MREVELEKMQQTTRKHSPYSTDLRGRTTFNVHRFQGEQQHDFLRALACIPRLSYNFSKHRN
jgi:hypothetical protein